MASRELAEGWFTPAGEPRFEILETLSREGTGGLLEYVAADRLLARDVHLVLGGPEVLEAARVLGRIEHPAAVTFFATGRDPEGRSFMAGPDTRAATSFADLARTMSREEALRVVLVAAGAVDHAASRNVGVEDLDLGNVIRFPDGGYRVTGFSLEPPKPGELVRALQNLLRRTILAGRSAAPRELWRIVRHGGYPDAAAFRADLAGYCEGAATLAATGKRALVRRVSFWARRHPGRATAVAGTLFVALVVGLLGLAAVLIASAEDREAIGARHDEVAGAREEALAQGRAVLKELGARDRARLEKLAVRRELYHQVSDFRPDKEEIELDQELARMSHQREDIASRAAGHLELAASRGADVARERGSIEAGRLEFLFAVAAFEEEKTLSTRTVERARATRPVGDALFAADAEGAAGALARLADAWPEHPYLAAAKRLAGLWDEFGDEARPGAFGEFAQELLARGTLAVVGPESLELTLVRADGGEAMPLEAGRAIELDLGVYLLEVTRDAGTLKFEILIERSESERVDARALPEEVPEGYIWIAPAVFYRGGQGLDPGRYRKARVEDGFAIARTELSWGEVPVELPPGVDPRWPLSDVTHEQAGKIAEEIGRSFPGWTGRLPTEEEWELAARGVAGRVFPWGDQLVPGVANVFGYSDPWMLCSVGVPESDVSITGVLGMGGNVAEWTSTPARRNGSFLVKGGYYGRLPDEAASGGKLEVQGTFSQYSTGVRPVLVRVERGG